MTLWCKPEANKWETSLLQAVALSGASLPRVMLPPPLKLQKHAVSVPSAEHRTAILAGGGSGWDEPVSPPGAGSLTTFDMSVPMDASTQPRSIQYAAAQKPGQSTNHIRESEQWSCDYELQFSERCAQPVEPACSSLRWDSAGWGI